MDKVYIKYCLKLIRENEMKKIVLLGLMLLAACATVKPMYVRDGVQVYRATCNGAIRDIGDCYALAAEQCAGKFEEVNIFEDDSTKLSNKTEDKYSTYGSRGKNTVSNTTGIKTSVINRALYFYCK